MEYIHGSFKIDLHGSILSKCYCTESNGRCYILTCKTFTSLTPADERMKEMHSFLCEFVEILAVRLVAIVSTQSALTYSGKGFELMGCFSKKKDEGRDVSRKIDDQIRGEKAAYQANHRLLFLGSGESGKSTIIKQIKSLHDDAVDDIERKEKVEVIKENIKDGILAIINAMETIDPPCKLANQDLQWRVDWIRDKMSTTGNGNYTDEFFDHVEAVWQDEGIQETFKRSHEYRLIDCAQYFLNRVATIRKADYSPTAEDYLGCLFLTRGIIETRIQIDGVTLTLFDVGGQSEERRKWI